jgi:hypothetical protein
MTRLTITLSALRDAAAKRARSAEKTVAKARARARLAEAEAVRLGVKETRAARRR